MRSKKLLFKLVCFGVLHRKRNLPQHLSLVITTEDKMDLSLNHKLKIFAKLSKMFYLHELEPYELPYNQPFRPTKRQIHLV